MRRGEKRHTVPSKSLRLLGGSSSNWKCKSLPGRWKSPSSLPLPLEALRPCLRPCFLSPALHEGLRGNNKHNYGGFPSATEQSFLHVSAIPLAYPQGGKKKTKFFAFCQMTPQVSQMGLWCECDPSYKRHLFWKLQVWRKPHLKSPNEERAPHFLSWKFTPIMFLVDITVMCFKAEPLPITDQP